MCLNPPNYVVLRTYNPYRGMDIAVYDFLLPGPVLNISFYVLKTLMNVENDDRNVGTSDLRQIIVMLIRMFRLTYKQ